MSMRAAWAGLALGLFVCGGDAWARGRDDKAAREAFQKAYPVFMHPRCMNCHPAGDRPLQGDASRPHGQNVRRGPDGKGMKTMRCANCHQAGNLAGEGMPPGNPHWQLPRPEMPLVFEGRSPGELARQLKDRKRNGGKSLAEVLAHLERDSLVLWAWDPGDGRAPPPMSHAEFVRHFRTWVEKGAASPR